MLRAVYFLFALVGRRVRTKHAASAAGALASSSAVTVKVPSGAAPCEPAPSAVKPGPVAPDAQWSTAGWTAKDSGELLMC